MKEHVGQFAATFGIGLLAGGVMAYLTMRGFTATEPRTRTDLLRKAQEYNLRALRAPSN